MKARPISALNGVMLIALFSFSAYYIASYPLFKHLSFSPMIIGILLGMLYANTLRQHPSEDEVAATPKIGKDPRG